MTGGSAKVHHVHWSSMQGDMKFLKLLEQMGCTLTEEDDGIRLNGPSDGLKGLEVDMNDFSDQALTLAAIAPYASSDVTITHIGHIRGQECDRLHAIVMNLKKQELPVKKEMTGYAFIPENHSRAGLRPLMITGWLWHLQLWGWGVMELKF